MTETPKTFDEAMKELRAKYPQPIQDFVFIGRRLWNAGHAAGRLEGLEEAAKWLDEQKKFMGSNEPSILAKDIRALAKEKTDVSGS